MTSFFTVVGIAALWAGGAVAFQVLCNRVILYLPFSVYPPRWWWYSPLPWPSSIITAAAFALVAMAASLACIRGGITSRQLVSGAVAGVALLWAVALVGASSYVSPFGVGQALSSLRIHSAIGYAGTVGSLAGAFAAAYLRNRTLATGLAST